MKVKITEPTIIKKSSKIINISQTNGSSYNMFFITLKKKNLTKILFI